MRRHWLHAHRLDHGKKNWSSLDLGALIVETRCSVLKPCDDRLIEAWLLLRQSTSAVDVLLSFTLFVFRDTAVAGVPERRAKDPGLVTAHLTWRVIGFGILLTHGAADDVRASLGDQFQMRLDVQ